MPIGTRTSWPAPAVYFSDAGQEVIVSAAQVRAGAPDLPYTLTQANVTVPDGTSSYTGCQAWRNTVVSDLYTRPDATTLSVSKGAGTPTGPVDVCVTTVIDSRQIALTWKFDGNWTQASGYTNDGFGCGSYSSVITPKVITSNTVNKTVTKNTETGGIITTVCAVAPGAPTLTPDFSTTCSFSVSCGNAVGMSPAGCNGDSTVRTINTVPPCPF